MRPSYMFMATFLMTVGAPLWGQSVKAGIDAWQGGDYPKAVAIWRPLADLGNADAAFDLGQAYRLGRGTQTSLADARKWFEIAARKSHVEAQTALGLLLFQNGDQAAGFRWLKAASEKGEPRAMLVYGTALFNGDNMARDPVQGYCYVSRAVAQGLDQAKATKAQMEQVVPVDARKVCAALAIATAHPAPPPRSPSLTADAKPEPAKTSNSIKPAVAPPPSALELGSAVQTPRMTEPFGAASSAETSGAWRVQLGAFVKRASAEAVFARLVAGGALAGRQIIYSQVRAVTRLQAGPFATKAAAEAACAALMGEACFVVPPPSYHARRG